MDVADGVLTLGFSSPGPRENFGSGGSDDVLADSLIQVIGVELRINAVLSSGEETTAPAQRPAGGRAAAPAPAPEPESQRTPPQPERQPETEVSSDDEVLDVAHNAEELLSSTFGAEVISVREAE